MREVPDATESCSFMKESYLVGRAGAQRKMKGIPIEYKLPIVTITEAVCRCRGLSLRSPHRAPAVRISHRSIHIGYGAAGLFSDDILPVGSHLARHSNGFIHVKFFTYVKMPRLARANQRLTC